MEIKGEEEVSITQKRAKKVLTGHNNLITTISLTKDASRLIVGCEDGVLYIWKVDNLNVDPELKTLELHKGQGEITNIVPIMKPV